MRTNNVNKEIDYSRLSALVVDDQPFIRNVIAMLLRQMGFKAIFQAGDGGGGLREIRRHAPDIVLCDIEMEPIDGLVFLETIRHARDVREHEMPIIFLTCHTESDLVERARELGVSSYLLKPPSLTALKERVDFVLAAA